MNIGVAFSLLIFVLGSGLITFAHERHRRIGDTKSVVGVDMTLQNLAAALGKLSTRSSGEIMLFTPDGKLLGSDKPGRLGGGDEVRPSGSSPRIADFDEPILDELFHRFIEGDRDASLIVNAGGQPWFASIRPGMWRAGCTIVAR